MKPEAMKKILIVDDNKPLLRVLGDFLEFRGFDVAVAESGEDGLKKIVASPPDIILLDISMPGMGGMGFLKRIMLDNGTLQYPVLVITARTTTEDYFKEVPVDGFIAKPCDKPELVDKIKEILEKHKKSPHKTILVGEDDSMALDRLAKVFRMAGFEVEEAVTGPAVLEKAVANLPDAVLVKAILVGMNGDAVASILQAMPRTQSIPVLIYDAREPESCHQCVGTNKFFSVTKDPVTLLNTVKGVLCKPDTP